jgi:hypothetical protein
VPTPFYHLSIADQLLDHPQIDPAVKDLLKENLGPFYLGNTAPDVQVISGQNRTATHFFSVPISRHAKEPWRVMISDYPGLRAEKIIDPEQTVFIAGYLCHLQADWIWVSEIFEPVFGPQQGWRSFKKRLYLHNVLRAYLDVEVTAALALDRILEIGSVASKNWVPFIRDQHLENWWIFLLDQLQPGKPIKTVEVFADRQGIAVQEFQAMLESEESLQENIFEHVSRDKLDLYRRKLVANNVSLIENYLGPRIAPKSQEEHRFFGYTGSHNGSGI